MMVLTLSRLHVLYIDTETVRSWRRLYVDKGIKGLELKTCSQREGLLNRDQERELCGHFTNNPARSTHEVRAFICIRFGISYSQSGAIKAMHRLGFTYKKPKPLPLGASVEDQQAQNDKYTS